MKHGMKSKVALAKSCRSPQSSFLKSMKRGYTNVSELRKSRRSYMHSNGYPSSTKVGAGEITARRRLPLNVVHRRNHRENDRIKG